MGMTEECRNYNNNSDNPLTSLRSDGGNMTLFKHWNSLIINLVAPSTENDGILTDCRNFTSCDQPGPVDVEPDVVWIAS